MPVILPAEHYKWWLDNESAGELFLSILQQYPAPLMAAFPVGNLVNNARNDLPDCLKPTK